MENKQHGKAGISQLMFSWAKSHKCFKNTVQMVKTGWKRETILEQEVSCEVKLTQHTSRRFKQLNTTNPNSRFRHKTYHSNVWVSETYEKYYVAKGGKAHQSNKGDIAFTKQQIIQSNSQNSIQTSADTLTNK